MNISLNWFFFALSVNSFETFAVKFSMVVSFFLNLVFGTYPVKGTAQVLQFCFFRFEISYFSVFRISFPPNSLMIALIIGFSSSREIGETLSIGGGDFSG